MSSDIPSVDEERDTTAAATDPVADYLADLASRVGVPDESSAAAAHTRWDSLTKPVGALGRLEDLGTWICSVQGECPPRALTRPRLVIFAGDHGVVTSAGTSAYPSAVTAEMVRNFLQGGAAANVLARQHGVGIRVVDVAVDVDWEEAGIPVPEQLTRFKVRRSSRPLDQVDPLTRAESWAAFRAGIQIAEEEVDAGADLLIAGDMGIGNTTAAAALTGVLCRLNAAEVVGRGTGIDDDTWMRKTAAVRNAMFRARHLRADPIGLLAAAGGADLAAMAGFLTAAAARGVPVLLDGAVVGAAALVASVVSYRGRLWWVAGHRSVEPAHTAALARLRLEPIVDLQMRLGEGSGALVALPIVVSAVELLRDMATFAAAGVSGGDGPAQPTAASDEALADTASP